eukprot:CAMPEP_0204619710 /NCGR_PEP_ID=MMETSP0717-20131115/5990_1 /ASSEMBLY_ACC=CAM_ASM_000666 /TAXON_ID=230516 /ORGANISM="Chaetoceros curvisetus" /LENGTH=113 /DNA_ID=CAMNT_0051633755 /DNA_START=87 /DNA_END=428 /DNA_ORIENTATION=-
MFKCCKSDSAVYTNAHTTAAPKESKLAPAPQETSSTDSEQRSVEEEPSVAPPAVLETEDATSIKAVEEDTPEIHTMETFAEENVEGGDDKTIEDEAAAEEEALKKGYVCCGQF